MIIINVLPPEYRRRDIGVNPITLTIAGVALVNVVILLLWAYIQFISIPQAIDIKTAAANDRALAKVAADAVKKVDDEISKANKRFEELEELLSKKVYWAKTLSDFVTILSIDERINNDEFHISIDSLVIKEKKSTARPARGKKKKKASVARIFDLDWTARIVALDAEKIGEHTNALFTVFEGSEFWGRQGPEASSFMDQPDTRYSGIKIEINEDIEKAVTKFDLQWKRYIPARVKKVAAKSVNKDIGKKPSSETPKEGAH